MSHSSAVAAFVKPVIALTALQKSVVNFMNSTTFGIASSPRQTGMTFALHSQLIYQLQYASDTTTMVVFSNVTRMRSTMSELKQFMSVLGSNRLTGNIKSDMQFAYIENMTTNVSIVFTTIEQLTDHRLRGRSNTIDHLIYEDFDGAGPYARKIQQSLMTVMPILSRNSDYKIHLIGTDGNAYVDSVSDKDGILYAAMHGKSQFVMWNYQLSTMVDELLDM